MLAFKLSLRVNLTALSSEREIAEILHYFKTSIGKKFGVSGRFNILRILLMKQIVRIKDLELDDDE